MYLLPAQNSKAPKSPEAADSLSRGLADYKDKFSMIYPP